MKVDYRRSESSGDASMALGGNVNGPARIVVVDDEPSITDAVATALGYEGFDVAEAHGGRDALDLVVDLRPDLVILDVMLPDLDGMTLLRRLRQDGVDVPVLFLTARDEPSDRVEGLVAGGDDYVTKPFTLAEVVARVHAILRRTRGDAGGDGLLRFADVVMNDETREAWRGDERLQLTATEFNLLRFFMRNPKRVLSKAQILDAVWHYDFGGNPNVVETYVSYLRKKLDRFGPPLIQTIRLVGYALREPEQ
jgi:two-component system, OmpR family, response regulator